MPELTRPPKVFISYAWENDLRPWVLAFAKRLRKDGVETVLDQWETDYGDQLPEFMEKAVRSSDFVILICTPKYKKKSDERQGGVGYEGHIITAEIFQRNNHRKFIPVLRKGKWLFAAPSWATAKLYIDLSANPYSEENYRSLLKTLHGRKPMPPPVGTPPDFSDEEEDSHRRPNPFAKFYLGLINSISMAFARFKLSLSGAKPFFRKASFTAMIIGIFWVGFRIVFPLISFPPPPNATATLSMGSPIPDARTPRPNKTSTPGLIQKVLALPTATNASTRTDSNKTSPIDGAKMIFVPASNGMDAFWIDRTAVTTSMFGKFVQSTGYVTDAEKNKIGFVWTFLGEMAATQFPGQTGIVYEWKLKSGVSWKNPPLGDGYTGNEVLQVSWNDATAYCRWAGRELLTMNEWELARASGLPVTFYNNPDGLGEWGEDKTTGTYRVVLGRQDIKWGGYTTYVFQEDGFIEYRSANRLTFRCKDR